MKIAKIEIGWEPSLLKNQSHYLGDNKQGITKSCKKAVYDIVMLLRGELRGRFRWNGERIQVVITAYRPRTNIDAQNFVDAISDAIQIAINVNDSNFDVVAVGKTDTDNPRIEIELIQEMKDA